MKTGSINHLEELCHELEAKDKEANKEEVKEKTCKHKFISKYIKLDASDDEVEVKPKKPKLTTLKYIVVFDNLSTELKDKCIPKLLKRNRHFFDEGIDFLPILEQFSQGCAAATRLYADVSKAAH